MPHYRLHRDPRSSHQQIARRLRELKASPILDVGAAQGMLGELLKDSGLAIDAVEMNPQWAEICRPNYRSVYTGAIEGIDLPGQKYSAIVCGDVLEHTADPIGVLKKLHEYATPQTVYLISLPNVAHLAARLMLLAGVFPKMERGIFDKTHLHFFTRATAKRMLKAADLRPERVRGTGVPMAELWPGETKSAVRGLLMRMQYLAVDLLPRLFAMQFIFEARQIPAEKPGK